MNGTTGRRGLKLLQSQRVDKGGLVGRAKVRLPNQLETADIGIFVRDGRCWAQLRAEAMRDADGQILKDQRGKVRYRSPLKWATRDLQERFSAALIGLIESEHWL